MMISTLIKKYKFYFLSFLIIYLVWFLYANHLNNSLIMPKPNLVLKTFIDLVTKSKTYNNIFHTIIRFSIGLIISFALGLILGVFGGLYKWVEDFLHPFIVIFRSLPLASIIVTIMIVVGISKSPIVITSIILFPVIYQAILEGVKSIDTELMEVWKLDTNFNFFIARKVIIPQSSAFIKTALAQAIGLGYKVLIMAEFICQTDNSIGKALVSAKNNIEYDYVLAWSLIIIILVLFLEGLSKILTNTQ